MLACPLCNKDTARPKFVQNQYAECGNCSLRYLLPEYLLEEEEEKKRYLLHEHHAEDPGYEKYLAPLFDSISKKLPPKSRGLDYGSGPASVLGKMLKTAGFSVASYDPYFVEDPKVLEHPYDFVVAAEVVEHFYKPQSDFSALRKLVRPGGWLGIMTQLYDGVDFENWYYRRDPVHVSFYCKGTFEWIRDNFHWKTCEILPPKTILLEAN